MHARLDSDPTTETYNEEKHHSIAEKLHGLSEKIHQLGHIRQDSQGGIAGDGRRSRAGSTSAATHSSVALVTSTSNTERVASLGEATPDPSIHSRSSSKKSNHSIHSIYGGDKLLSRRRSSLDVLLGRIYIKDLACCFALLEAGRPEDKLEFPRGPNYQVCVLRIIPFGHCSMMTTIPDQCPMTVPVDHSSSGTTLPVMFRLYDVDGNGILDASRMTLSSLPTTLPLADNFALSADHVALSGDDVAPSAENVAPCRRCCLQPTTLPSADNVAFS
ncbi:hypothetical protein LSAT2_024705 [Lamellibrachia satsuma]|nr:hypothetical protein LSAT2_024705 [Lamellibrachia satsuma]